MGTNENKSIKMKIFQKGQVVIPVSLRKKYLIEIGDLIDVIPSPEGILLKPRSRATTPESLTDRLCGIFNQYTSEKTRPSKSEIQKVTEKEFTEGWKK